MGGVVAPGPFLPTVWASAVIAACGTDAQRSELLPGLADGSVRAAVGLDDRTHLVLGAGLAELFLLPDGDDLVVATRDDVTVEVPANVDATRRIGTVTRTGAAATDRVLVGARATAVVLGRILAAAEATGGAQACVTMASEYAKVREQFGRVIAMFQAVKHQAADMLVATQLATAATWDAARTEPGTPELELAAAVAAAQALPAFVMCAEKNIQLHGGIGFTWEHDAHVYLKRALALAAVFGPSRRDRPRRRAPRRRRREGCARGRAPARGGDVPRRGARVRRAVRRHAGGRAARRLPRLGLRAGALARTVGPGRGRGRAARDRGGAARRRRAPAAVRHRRLDHPDPHAVRRRRPARALDPSQPRVPAHVVPALLGAGRRIRRRRCAHQGHQGRRRLEGHRPEGVDHRRRAVRPRARHRAHRSRQAEARRHHRAGRSTCTRPASTSVRCARPPGTRCSTRCSSTTCSCPTRTSSDR